MLMFRRVSLCGLIGLGVMALVGCSGSGSSGGSGGGSGTPTAGPATQLVVVQQPSGAVAGSAFGTQPRVEIQDAMGVRVSSDNTTSVNVAISTGTGTGGAVLSGTMAVTANAGVVTFSGLAIDLAGTGYTLDFTAGGLTSATSTSFDVTTPTVGGGSAPFVPPAPSGTATYYVDDSGSASDTNNGTSPSTPWRTLQHAADNVSAGDIVEIADGSYSRFTMNSVTGTPGNKVVFRASGTGAIINSGTSSSISPDNRDAIKVYDCSHVIFHGLRTTSAYRAGIRVSESFFVTVQGCVFGDNGKWGIFTDYSDDLVLEGNECFNSAVEHGIYFSNSGDRVVIRGNYCHGNNASGIQINSDPAQQNASFGTRGDGITEGAVIENNWCVGNGTAGGAALNFASIRNCDIRNNLLVNNLGQSGIALWDDGYSSSYGSMNNRIYHNTVVFQTGVGRFCLTMLNGSTGNDIKNNIFIGGRRGAITWSTDSLSGMTADYNVCRSVDGWDVWVNDTTSQGYTLSQWQTLVSGAANSYSTAPTFTSGSDYHLQAASAGKDDGTGVGVSTTHDGGSRPQGAGYDRGCFE